MRAHDCMCVVSCMRTRPLKISSLTKKPSKNLDVIELNVIKILFIVFPIAKLIQKLFHTNQPLLRQMQMEYGGSKRTSDITMRLR